MTIRFSLLLATSLSLLSVHSDAAESDPWQWPQAEPAEVGLDKDLLSKAHRRIKRGKYKLVDSMLVIRHGRLAYEKYYNNGQKSKPHALASAAKSLLSALVGIAVDQRVISSVETKISAYFSTYYRPLKNPSSDKDNIRLQDLLTMRSGWDCNILETRKRCGRLMTKNRDASEALKWVLDRPMKYPPGQQMQYTDANPAVVNSLLYLASGKTPDQWAQQYLLQPMSIKANHFNLLTSRQMAMFGQLFLNQGRWQGQQIISKNWVRSSTSALHKNPPSKFNSATAYGYFWWVGEFTNSQTNNVTKSYWAAGNGGQYIVVLPSLDMVVVFTGSNYQQLSAMRKTLTIIENYIIPAVVKL